MEAWNLAVEMCEKIVNKSPSEEWLWRRLVAENKRKELNHQLIDAAERNDVDVVKLLLEERGADITVKDNDGWTVLHWAARNGQWEVVKWLVEERGADITANDNDGWTVLHLVARSGQLEVVKWLVEKRGADITAKTNNGYTAVGWAASAGQWEVVEWLKKRNPDNPLFFPSTPMLDD
jgi:ankyrin repeat protein